MQTIENAISYLRTQPFSFANFEARALLSYLLWRGRMGYTSTFDRAADCWLPKA